MTKTHFSFFKNTSNNPFLTKQQLEEQLMENPISFAAYQSMKPDWKEKFIGFFQGRNLLPLTYDPFFKKIFNPTVHPDRLSRLISSILGFKVRVKQVLSNEDSIINLDALLIMDILVELEDGSLANVEIQKIPYLFPAERMSCYSADLVMRQYARVKGEMGKGFKYSDIKKVYCIVIFEDSTMKMRNEKGDYIHFGSVTFDTGIEFELIQKFCLICLDEYRKCRYDKNKVNNPKIDKKFGNSENFQNPYTAKNELDGWLGFIATESLEEAETLIKDYPWLEEIYKEISSYIQKPKEVFSMFSEALKILDHNTAMYMVEEQQKALKEMSISMKKKDTALLEKDSILLENAATIASLQKELEKYKKELAESRQEK